MPTINNRFENLTLERLQEIYDIVSVPVSTGLTVGVTTITGGTVGRVLFQGTGDVLQQSSNLFWDNTNARLGVGVTPIRTLHVQHIGTTGVTGSLLFWNQDNSYTSLSVLSNGVGFSLSGHTNGTGYISATSSINITNNNGTNPSVIWLGNGSRFRLSNTAETQTYLVVANTGNVLVNTTTDAGYKIDVNGTARISGITAIAAGTLTGVTSTSALDISQTWNTTGTPSAIRLNVTNTASNGNSKLVEINVDGNNRFSIGLSSSLIAAGSSGNQGTITLTSSKITHFLQTPAVGISHQFNTAFAWFNNTGSFRCIGTASSIAPTSGNATYSAFSIEDTINQTGGANGITRGLYVNPTLTAAADFRAIETTAGNVLFGSNFFWDNTNTRLNVGTNLGAYGRTWIQSNIESTNEYTLVLNNLNSSGSGSSATGIYFANSGNSFTSQPYNVKHIVGSIKALATSWDNVYTAGLMTFNLNNTLGVQEEVMRLVHTTKNVLIGTTTDAGFKLDVNGTSAFRGIVRIFAEQQLRQEGITQTFTSSLGIFRFSGWSTGSLTAYINGWNYEGYLNFAVNIGTSSTAVASAVLEVTSTTRGFLPPRMTTAQKTAIATPAVGLVVYDTTLNKLCVYTTTWETITSA